MKTCHSGGAPGADTIFELESLKHKYKVCAYSFKGHNTKSNNKIVLSDNELNEGFEHIKKTNKRLNRNILNAAPYTKNLIARDWFQVKYADTIFAVGNIETPSTVQGGTGYACSCAVDEKNQFISLNKMIINGIIMIINQINLKSMKVFQN